MLSSISIRLAWAIQHCALITHREPDFVRMGQENRYYGKQLKQCLLGAIWA